MMFFAQTPSAQTLGAGLQTFFFWASLAGNAALVLGLAVSLRRRKEQREILPQPLTVKLAEEFVKKEECIAQHSVGSTTLTMLKADIAELRSKGEKDRIEAGYSRKAIYAEIKGAMEQTTTHIEQVRRELSDKIDEMPDRMIAIFKNFGAIGKP